MLSQKLQDDLMSAYQKVYEEKRGHAAGDSDVEKQASQLASDVRYKAKGKVKPGASDEEKKKVFIQILGSSPAPQAVKSMAKQKLMGEEVVQEMRFDDGPEGTKKRKEALRKKRGLTKDQMDKHPQFKTEGKAYGITKGDGMSFPERLKKKAKEKKMKMSEGTKAKKFIDDKAKKLKKEYDAQPQEYKNNPAFQSNRLNPKPQYNSHELQGEVVSEMGGIKVKPEKPDKNKKDMSKGSNEKAPVDYRVLAQSHKPVGNIFNEKKMDPVGQEDGDINNDGKKDGTDKYLLKRRKAIGKAIAKKRGKVKEGFSAWRIDLDFNEQVKK